jgi:hypothetical protein
MRVTVFMSDGLTVFDQVAIPRWFIDKKVYRPVTHGLAVGVCDVH